MIHCTDWKERMLKDNKALVRRFVTDFQAAGNAEVADELVAADLTHHSGPAWACAATVGPERARQVMAELRAAFGDLHAVIHDQIAEGDKVVTRKTFYGTHRGEFRAFRPPVSRWASTSSTSSGSPTAR